MIFDTSHDDRKVRQFSLSNDFLAGFAGKQPKWGPVGYFTYKRCVDTSTPVLCDDLQWRPAGSLREGQGIIGFDEERQGQKMRHIRHGVVTHNKVEMAETVGIELEDGTTLYATPDHGWLVKLSESDNRLYWRESKDLESTHKGGAVHLVRPFGPMWTKDGSFEGGFLSAAYDGEGCLDRHNNLSFVQVGNPMLEKVESILQDRRIPYKKYDRKRVEGRQQVHVLRTTHRADFYRMLGMFQPPRLMAKFREHLMEHGGGALRTRPEDYVKVVRVFPAGERPIAVLSTSVKTHFTGGFASHNTYAMTLDEETGQTEEYWQTCQRVVEGVYNIQKIHCRRLGLPWSEPKAQRSAQEMFRRMWDFKFTPPGRGLAQMGRDFMFEKGGACLNNCAFISSENIDDDFADPFTFLMDMSMLGVGVGGDTRGAGKVRLQVPKVLDKPYVVPDTREGWVAMAKACLNPFAGKGSFPSVIDFSQVRKAGEPIKGFGGTASGPGPLSKLAKSIATTLVPEGVVVVFEETFNPETGEITSLHTSFEGEGEPRKITSGDITDIFNMVGACVVAGGVRRSAEIMFGQADDQEFRTLKDPTDLNAMYAEVAGLQQALDAASPEADTASLAARIAQVQSAIEAHPLRTHRWASNNSIFATVGMDYEEVGESIAKNGEPGLLWLKNAQDYGRMIDAPDYKDRRAKGANPCSEQTLESYELCCVSSDTRITTRTGAPRISEVVGQQVDVWNGERWSTVTPFVAAQGKKLYRVRLSDGSFLDCTDDHKWEVLPPGKRTFRQVETQDLVLGSKAVGFNIAMPCEGSHVEFAYEWGFFTGDGYIDHNQQQVMSALHGSDRKLEGVLRGKVYKEQHPEGYAAPFARINFTGFFREAHPEDFMSRAVALNDKTSGLPDWVFSMNRESTLRFIAGWIEADGNVCKQVNTDNYRVFGTEAKMRDLQMLLRRIGVNHASVFLMAEAGQTLVINGRETTRNHDLWVCLVPSFECEEISRYCHLKVAQRFGSRYAANNAHPEGAPIDRARKQKIVDIEELPGEHTTYCFTEPERHMGVFGNVLTYQCLVETYPAHHDSYEDYERTLKFAYLYAKTVTLVPTHNPRTNAVMNRNRRIGCSMSGIRQAIEKLGRRGFLGWCDQGYQYIQQLDEVYADWLGIPRSIKTTSVKPSGTVSLLCGATPGVHPPHSPFYIRNIRVHSESPLLQAARDAGYKVEKDAYADRTFVISFPVKTENCRTGKRDVSIWDQVALASDIQRYWADNQVSVTVTFTADEASEIPRVLEVFEDRLKSISFLPLGDDHGYVQAPYIEITEAEYDEMMAAIKPMDMSHSVHEQDDMYCDGEACMIDFGS